jgi:hypothetical protein
VDFSIDDPSISLKMPLTRLILNKSVLASKRTMSVTGRVDADVVTDLSKLPRTVSSPRSIPHLVVIELICIYVMEYVSYSGLFVDVATCPDFNRPPTCNDGTSTATLPSV